MFNYGIFDKYSFSRKEMEESAQIPEKTTTSRIINELLDEKVLLKEERGIYKINPFIIEFKLNEIRKKYI